MRTYLNNFPPLSRVIIVCNIKLHCTRIAASDNKLRVVVLRCLAARLPYDCTAIPSALYWVFQACSVSFIICMRTILLRNLLRTWR